MITIIVASSALPKVPNATFEIIIVASSALPRVPNATFDRYIEER